MIELKAPTQMKRYSEHIARITLAGCMLLTALVALSAPREVQAQPASYASQRREIRACVLVSSATSKAVPNNNTPSDNNPTPYVFYALENRTDYLPAGWDFINPIAPTSVTGAIYNRWKNRQQQPNTPSDPAFGNNTAQQQLFHIGAPVTKNLGCYWEVDLDKASDSTLSNFDVVFLPIQGGRIGGNVQFSEAERELMRHFVDQGGTLWIENEGSNTFNSLVGQFFLPLQTAGVNGGAQQIARPFHPLVTYPLAIEPTEVGNLGRYISTSVGYFTDPNSNAVSPQLLAAIVTQTQPNATTVYAGDLGAGHIVITSSVAYDINGLIVGGGANALGTNKVAANSDVNDGAVSGANFTAIPPVDLKLGYNICGWAGSLPVGSANARRTGSTQETIGYGIATKWSSFPQTPTAGNPGSGAIIFSNAAFYVDGANVLHAYDVNPQESLSFSGLLPDDGIQDFIFGTPYDEIWNAQLGNAKNVHYGTPSVVSTNGFDALVVTGSDGTTSVFNALPRNGNGALNSTSPSLFSIALGTDSGNASIFGQNPNAPNTYPLTAPGAVYDDGVLFAPVYTSGTALVPASWHVAAIDLYSSLTNGSVTPAFGGSLANSTVPSTQSWSPALPALGDIVGPLSVGYVRDVGTGAIDEVVYASVAGGTITASTTPTTPYLAGFWFRTRQEPLVESTDKSGNVYWHPQGARTQIPWFLGNGSSSYVNLAPVIHITHLDANGNVLDVNDIPYASNNLSGPVINFDNTTNANAPTIKVTNITVPVTTDGSTYAVSADYALDWTGDAVGSGIMGSAEMTRIATARQYKLYVDANQTPGNTPVQPVPTGGVAIGSDDSAILAASSGLKDQSMVPGLSLPDRIFSITEQYTGVANNLGQSRSTSSAVNWMFSPLHGGSFDGNTIRARLINSDTFRTGTSATPNPDAIPIGQVVQGTTGGATQPNGYPAPGFQIVGAPVVSNGVVYVVANVHFNGAPFTSAPGYYNATVVLALKEKIDNTINLATPITVTANNGNPGSAAAGLTIRQPNLSQSVSGAANYLMLHPVLDQGTGDFTVDTTTDNQNNIVISALHILNMQPQGQDCINVAEPMYLVDGTGTQTPLVNANGYSLLDNLLWWIVIPYSDQSQTISPQGHPVLLQPDLQDIGGNASSGPAVFAQTLYYNATYAVGSHRYGSIVSVDLQNASVDGKLIDGATGISRVHVLNTMTDPNTGGPYDLASGGAVTPVINPPAAAVNTVVDGVGAGIAALDNQVTLIADSNRLIEVDAFSNAVWTLNSTSSVSVAGGPLTGAGGVASQIVPLARPTTARHLETNVFAVADTENNRIIQLDRGGQVTTEIHGLNNGMNFLKPGEPLTLNHPSDVQIYQDQPTSGTLQIFNRLTQVTYSYTGPYLATHYVVADTGNSRALEIVTVYNPVTGAPVTMGGTDGSSAFMQQQVIFSTRSLAEQNANYRYRTIQEFADPTQSSNTYMIAAVDNVQQSSTLVSGNTGATATGAGPAGEAPGGSLMVIRRNINNTGNANNDGDIASVFNTIAIPNAAMTQIVLRQPITGPTFFREFDYVNPNAPATAVPRFLMCDANGCYMLSLRYTNGNALNVNATQTPNELVVEWMLTDTDYYYLTGRHLRATSIQRLTQAEIYTDANGNKAFAPHYLITNTYSGRDNINEVFGGNNGLGNVADGDIHGEVFEIRSRDYFDAPNGNAAIDQNNGGVYNGYHYAGFSSPNAYQLYYVTNNLLYPNVPSITGNVTGTSIVRMVPAETIQYQVVNGNNLQLPIKRSIGDPTNATTSNLLQQPLFSERPF
jgi:hypothetical protein